MSILNGDKCDWSGEAGIAPTIDELCKAHNGRENQLRFQCRHKQQEVT
jgi:hypothetical protein